MHSVFPGFPFLSVCQLSDLIGRKSWLVGCLFGIVSLCSTFQLCVDFVAFSSALSCRGLIFLVAGSRFLLARCRLLVFVYFGTFTFWCLASRLLDASITHSWLVSSGFACVCCCVICFLIIRSLFVFLWSSLSG